MMVRLHPYQPHTFEGVDQVLELRRIGAQVAGVGERAHAASPGDELECLRRVQTGFGHVARDQKLAEGRLDAADVASGHKLVRQVRTRQGTVDALEDTSAVEWGLAALRQVGINAGQDLEPALHAVLLHIVQASLEGGMVWIEEVA